MADYDILTSYLNARRFRHETLVELHSNYPVIYLANVFFLNDGKLIIKKKLGWTYNILFRQDSLQSDMKTTCIFTHVFKCIRAHTLEQEILKIPIIDDHLYKDPINGHISKETIEFDDIVTEEYLINLINSKLPEFNIAEENKDFVQLMNDKLNEFTEENKEDIITTIKTEIMDELKQIEPTKNCNKIFG